MKYTNKIWATRHGQIGGYFVEVRVPPAGGIVDGNHIGPTWTRLEFPKTKGNGVPALRDCTFAPAIEQGVLSYESAMALMAWTAANGCDYETEFRLVAVQMEYSWSITEEGVGPSVCFDTAAMAFRGCIQPRELLEPKP